MGKNVHALYCSKQYLQSCQYRKKQQANFRLAFVAHELDVYLFQLTLRCLKQQRHSSDWQVSSFAVKILCTLSSLMELFGHRITMEQFKLAFFLPVSCFIWFRGGGSFFVNLLNMNGVFRHRIIIEQLIILGSI